MSFGDHISSSSSTRRPNNPLGGTELVTTNTPSSSSSSSSPASPPSPASSQIAKITSSLATINVSINNIMKIVNLIGTKKDTEEMRAKMQGEIEGTKLMIRETGLLIKNLGLALFLFAGL